MEVLEPISPRISFYGLIISYCIHGLHFVCPFTNYWTFGLATMNNATTNIHIQGFVKVFSVLLGGISEVEWLSHVVTARLASTRSCQAVFQTGYTILPSHSTV